MKANLSLYQFSIQVSLGCTEAERAVLQQVILEITLHFAQLPPACMSDELSDTVCYATLTHHIQRYCEGKSFKLLEHLSYQVYGFIKQQLNDLPITLSVTKCPPLAHLNHCTFTLSDQ